MPDPLVSFLLPAYNAVDTLPEALDSLLNQTVQDFEIVALDDGSTDDTLAVLRRYEQRDQRVVVITRPNTGLVGALNDALAACRGEFIARMDADDVAMPNRLELQLRCLESDSGLVAVGSAILRVAPDGGGVGYVHPPRDHETIHHRLLHGDGQAIVHPTLLCRAEAMHRLGGYDPRYTYGEDIYLFLRLAELGRLTNLTEVLLHYRLHPSSWTRTKSASMGWQIRHLVNEMRERQGMSPLPAPRLQDTEASSHGDTTGLKRQPPFEAMISQSACKCEHWPTARRYARKAVWSHPTHPLAWRAVLRAYLKRGR